MIALRGEKKETNRTQILLIQKLDTDFQELQDPRSGDKGQAQWLMTEDGGDISATIPRKANPR
jgi:hypothetical protein